MEKKAVDIILFPSEEIRNIAIHLNEKLRKSNLSKIILDAENVMPHISLAMGILDVEKLSKATGILEKIANSFKTLELYISEIVIKTSSNGSKMSSLQLAAHEELQKLHNQLVQEFSATLEKGASAAMFHSSPVVSKSSLSWVDDYLEKHSGSNFWPHITLGAGELNENFSAKFTANRLAICHLGNHCTCREILAVTTLKS